MILPLRQITVDRRRAVTDFAREMLHGDEAVGLENLLNDMQAFLSGEMPVCDAIRLGMAAGIVNAMHDGTGCITKKTDLGLLSEGDG